MRLSFKTGVFLSALGVGVLLLAQPATAHAQSSNMNTPAMAELEKKQMAAAQRRADLKAQIDQDQKKLEKVAQENPGGGSPQLHEKSGSGSFDLEGRRKKREAMREAQKKDLEKRRGTLASQRVNYSSIDDTHPRAAPDYLKDYLELVEEMDKKYAPYTLPPLSGNTR